MGIRERIAAIERYRWELVPASGIALVILKENDAWAAQYGKNQSTFPTQVQALHFVHQHAPQNVPVVIIDL